MTKAGVGNELSLSLNSQKEPEGRNLFIIGEMDEGLISTVVLSILKFNKEDANLKEREPINIYIHSPGGDVYPTFAIINAIENSETPIHTINIGQACSGGFMVLCAGHKRYAFKDAGFMLHNAAWGVSGKVPTMKSNMVEAENIERRIIDLLERRTLINEKDFTTVDSKEWWLTSEQALEYSVIDEIIGSK